MNDNNNDSSFVIFSYYIYSYIVEECFVHFAIGQNEDLFRGPALIDPSNKSMMFSSQVCFHFLFCIIVVGKIINQLTLAFQARTCFVLPAELRDSSTATQTRYGHLVLSQGHTLSFKDDDDDNEDDTDWGTITTSTHVSN